MNHIQVQYFLAVAQHLSFTEAAQSLYVSQPNLSKQILLLEQELGFTLFARTKRSVRLTPAGVVLVREFTQIKRSVEKAIADAKEANLGTSGKINIGCLTQMNMELFFPRIIKQFSNDYPDVELYMERHSFRALREKLMDGDLDVIFTLSFEIAGLPGVVSDVVCDTNPTLVLPATHPLTKRDQITFADLVDEPFITISRSESPGGISATINLCETLYGFTPRVAKECPNLESIFLYLQTEMGYTLLDRSVNTEDDPTLKTYDIPIADLSIVCAWKKDNLNPSIPLFVNLI
jgi:DNA-binding transcriptional LysR family regulator